MFQRFLRSRDRGNFHARSAGRDNETDQSRVADIDAAIATALRAAEAEHAGLSQRLEEVLARASVTFGNDSDEYLTRESLDSHHQDIFGTEIANAQRRLQELSVSIGHFKFLSTALRTRFPAYKAGPTDT
jgi:hypothetical protein